MTYNPLIHHRHSIRRKEYDYSSEGAYFVTICTHNSGNVFGHIENGKMHLNEYGKICNNEWLNTPNIRPNVKLITHVVMPNHFHALFIIKQKNNQRYIPVAQDEINTGMDDAQLGTGELPFAHMDRDTHMGETERHTIGEMERRTGGEMECHTGGEMERHTTGVLQYAHGVAATLDDINTIDNNDYIEFTYTSQYAPLTENEINEIRKMPHSPSQTVGAIVRGFKSAVTKQINVLRATPQMPVWQRNYHEYIITNERFFNNVANYILQNPERWGK